MKYEHKHLTIPISELTETLIGLKQEHWNLLEVRPVALMNVHCTFNRPIPDPYLVELDKTIEFWGGRDKAEAAVRGGLKMAKEIYLKLQK